MNKKTNTRNPRESFRKCLKCQGLFCIRNGFRREGIYQVICRTCAVENTYMDLRFIVNKFYEEKDAKKLRKNSSG